METLLVDPSNATGSFLWPCHFNLHYWHYHPPATSSNKYSSFDQRLMLTWCREQRRQERRRAAAEQLVGNNKGDAVSLSTSTHSRRNKSGQWLNQMERDENNRQGPPSMVVVKGEGMLLGEVRGIPYLRICVFVDVRWWMVWWVCLFVRWHPKKDRVKKTELGMVKSIKDEDNGTHDVGAKWNNVLRHSYFPSIFLLWCPMWQTPNIQIKLHTKCRV